MKKNTDYYFFYFVFGLVRFVLTSPRAQSVPDLLQGCLVDGGGLGEGTGMGNLYGEQVVAEGGGMLRE